MPLFQVKCSDCDAEAPKDETRVKAIRFAIKFGFRQIGDKILCPDCQKKPIIITDMREGEDEA